LTSYERISCCVVVHSWCVTLHHSAVRRRLKPFLFHCFCNLAPTCCSKYARYSHHHHTVLFRTLRKHCIMQHCCLVFTTEIGLTIWKNVWNDEMISLWSLVQAWSFCTARFVVFMVGLFVSGLVCKLTFYLFIMLATGYRL